MKTVIITGGSKGIGLEIAKTFLSNNYKVIVGSRTAPSLKEVEFIPMDVRKRSDHVKIVQQAMQKYGKLDAFINCAGISIWKPIDQIDENFWNDMMETNAAGTLWGCQAAAAVMKPGAAIINISSLAGKRGSANNTAYCASKFAVNGITQSLAKELGPKGIRVNAVCPVYVETKMILGQLTDKNSPSAGADVGQYLKSFAQSNAALQRLPLASEVAQTCLYLASDQSSAITGQCINVDCGVLPQ